MDINLGEPSESSSSTCALCHIIISPDNDGGGELEAISVCSDCKFLLMEDFEATRRPVSRRRRYDSSESMESMFSHQFSQVINLARQQNPSERDADDGDDAAARLVPRTTPSGSRRWRRVFSDTESDALDSLYGESESNASFRRYRTDTISYSAYGGESDASLDGQSLFENDNFGIPNGDSDLDSDNDIDPMNAGLFQWNSEEDDDSEWDEADIEENTLLESSFAAAAAQPHGSLVSIRDNVYINWRRQLLSPEVVGTFPLSIRERIQARTNFEEPLARNHAGDYLDARGFEDLLEHLAENESSKRGAPPASVSYIKNMPCLTINEDKLDSMACAVCKDSFTVGTVVNQLPCFHLYHPSCILPWLSARNTCPLCRYELPTDDKDYEARKRNDTLGIHQHDLNDDDTSLDAIATATATATATAAYDEPESQLHRGREEQSEPVDADSVRDIPRNRWLFLAAPIVSIVGISLVLWFGNPSAGSRLCPSDRIPCRRENNQRRWWSFF